MENSKFNELQELKDILCKLGPEKIWRPVCMPDKQILSEGIGDAQDGLTADLHGLYFHNKTVIDLGCNLGFYSFLVKNAGASSVLGLDIDIHVIRGCNIIKKMSNYDNISFRVQDITTLNGEQTYDIGILIDFIGKKTVQSGMLPKFLDSIERVSKEEMIISVRPIYRIKKHLSNDAAGLVEKYSTKYLRHGHFYTLEYVTDRFKSEWDIDIVSPKNDPEGAIKETVHLLRKISSK